MNNEWKHMFDYKAGATECRDFRLQATYTLAILTLFLLTPFAVNHIIQGRTFAAVGSLFIVTVMAISAREIRLGRQCSELILYVLLPSVMVFLTLSLRMQGIIGVLWTYPAILAFYCMLNPRLAMLANALILAVMVPSPFFTLDPALAMRVVVTLLAVSSFTAVFVHNIATHQARLEAQVRTDPLTGLFNRTSLSQTLSQCVEQNRRNHTPMTTLMLDIDNFKSVNDKYGHDAGDRVICGVSQLMQQHIRKGDQVFRIGGEEFLILLHGSNYDDSVGIAEKIRKDVEQSTMISGRQITMSVGMASLNPGEDHEHWSKRADAQLYRAKTSGRNCVAG